MIKYIHYFKQDGTDRDIPYKKGQIYCVTDECNGLDNCALLEVSDDILSNIFDYLFLDGVLVYDEDKIIKQESNTLKEERENLLAAFDKYKSNIQYGIQLETQEQKEMIVNWYQKILDLDADAIQHPPKEITYYL